MADQVTERAQELLDGGGPPAFKFPVVGTTVVGIVTAADARQQTDFATGVGLEFADGNPKMQLVIALDPLDGSDAGRIFAKGQMLTAVREAIKAVADNIAIGGTLAVRYDHDEASEKGNPQKIYTAEYKAPEPVANTGGLI